MSFSSWNTCFNLKQKDSPVTFKVGYWNWPHYLYYIFILVLTWWTELWSGRSYFIRAVCFWMQNKISVHIPIVWYATLSWNAAVYNIQWHRTPVDKSLTQKLLRLSVLGNLQLESIQLQILNQYLHNVVFLNWTVKLSFHLQSSSFVFLIFEKLSPHWKHLTVNSRLL